MNQAPARGMLTTASATSTSIQIDTPVAGGAVLIGADNPISVQSMCATRTRDIGATLDQIALLLDHRADLIRLAVDGPADVEALKQIRKKC